MNRHRSTRWPTLLAALLILPGPLLANEAALPADAASDSTTLSNVDVAADVPAASRSGSDVYQRFRDGLAEPTCEGDASPRWRQHFAQAPKRLASGSDDALPLFGYVVDALRAEHLPTEFALIPFVESGYKPAARSPGGPAGMWQFIALTARNHGVRVEAGYDGRLSPVDSTRAAVRYLKTLHGMFAGDWRLAAMAYNAGEYRILGALKRSGQTARNVNLDTLTGVPPIAQAYVRKLHALACVLDEADDQHGWRQAMQRQVPMLTDIELPRGIASLDSWASRNGIDAQALRRMNPAFANGKVVWGKHALRVLAPGKPGSRTERAFWPDPALAVGAGKAASTTTTPQAGSHDVARVHVVVKGDSIGKLARRYRVPVLQLLRINDLKPTSVPKPGQRVRIDPPEDD